MTLCRNRVGVMVRTNNNEVSISVSPSIVSVILSSSKPKVPSITLTVGRKCSATPSGIHTLNFNTKVKLPGVGGCASRVLVSALINGNAAVQLGICAGEWVVWSQDGYSKGRQLFSFHASKQGRICKVRRLRGTLPSKDRGDTPQWNVCGFKTICELQQVCRGLSTSHRMYQGVLI